MHEYQTDLLSQVLRLQSPHPPLAFDNLVCHTNAGGAASTACIYNLF